MNRFRRLRCPRGSRVCLPAAILALLAGLPTMASAYSPSYPPDPALEQKTTLEAVGEPLENLLHRLSLQTGVAFTFEGRQVGDRKAIVVVHDVALRQLKQALASTFFGFRWRQRKRRRDGQVEYVLFQDLRSKQIEEQLQLLPYQHRVERLRRLEAGLHDTNAAQQMNPQDRKLLHDVGASMALELLMQLPPGYVRALFATGSLTLSAPSLQLTPRQEAYWSQLAGQTLRQIELEQAGQRIISVDDLSSAQPYPLRNLPDAKFTLLNFEEDDGSGHIDLWLNSSLMPTRALGAARIALTGPDDNAASSVYEVNAFLDAAQPKRSELDEPIKPLSAQRRRELALPPCQAMYGPYWARWMVPLAKRTGIAVVSDYFTEKPHLVPKEPTGLTLREALEEGRRVFQRRWATVGPIYSFRHAHWFTALPLEPPQRIIDTLKRAFNTKGRLDVDDLAIGGELNKQQLSRAECMGLPYFWLYRDHYATMRLLGSLPPTQRRLAETRGITPSMLASPEERFWFETAAWANIPDLSPQEIPRVACRLTQALDNRNNLQISFHWRGPRGLGQEESLLLEAGATGK